MKRFLFNDWTLVCGLSALLIAVHLGFGETGANIVAGASAVGIPVLAFLTRRKEINASAAAGRRATAALMKAVSSQPAQKQTHHSAASGLH